MSSDHDSITDWLRAEREFWEYVLTCNKQSRSAGLPGHDYLVPNARMPKDPPLLIDAHEPKARLQTIDRVLRECESRNASKDERFFSAMFWYGILRAMSKDLEWRQYEPAVLKTITHGRKGRAGGEQSGEVRRGSELNQQRLAEAKIEIAKTTWKNRPRNLPGWLAINSKIQPRLTRQGYAKLLEQAGIIKPAKQK